MTSINAGGAFYRVQSALDTNSTRVSESMQRLASGKQNISPGDDVATVAISANIRTELASIKVGVRNGTEVLNALEMVTNDIATLTDLVIRLEELNALGENGLNTTEDIAAIKAEATTIVTEFAAVQSRALWRGNATFGGTAKIAFGRNSGSITLNAGTALAISSTAVASLVTPSQIAIGNADSTSAAKSSSIGIGKLKALVDALRITNGGNYNQVANTLDHLSNFKAGLSLDLASKTDVDFAGETTELAKGQILAQAGTAMLAQSNAQGQSMLALIQS